jgi:hypothetical protein
LQGEGLAAAQAGVHEQREQRRVAAALGRAEQLGGLRGRRVVAGLVPAGALLAFRALRR